MTWVPGEHAADKPAIGFFIRLGLFGIEFCELKEILRRQGYHKAMMSVGWSGCGSRLGRQLIGILQVIIPNELIGIGEGVLLKPEWARADGSAGMGGGATRNQHQ